MHGVVSVVYTMGSLGFSDHHSGTEALGPSQSSRKPLAGSADPVIDRWGPPQDPPTHGDGWQRPTAIGATVAAGTRMELDRESASQLAACRATLAFMSRDVRGVPQNNKAPVFLGYARTLRRSGLRDH